MDISINLTIHDKAFLLPESLGALEEMTDWTSTEIIFILDGCTDDSLQIVQSWCKRNHRIKSKIIETPNVFEVISNNVAAKASQGDYIIILQDDQIVDHYNWTKRILQPFQLFSDVFAVTGNCAHGWKLNPDSEYLKNPVVRNDRWCDLLIATDHANKQNFFKGVLKIRSTANRGPLAIKLGDLETMGYFDESFAPLDCDDHDLFYRMRKKLGKFVGYTWISWYSKPEWGGTRDENGKTKPWAYEAQNKNTLLFYERHKDLIGNNIIEDRIIT